MRFQRNGKSRCAAKRSRFLGYPLRGFQTSGSYPLGTDKKQLRVPDFLRFLQQNLQFQKIEKSDCCSSQFVPFQRGPATCTQWPSSTHCHLLQSRPPGQSPEFEHWQSVSRAGPSGQSRTAAERSWHEKLAFEGQNVVRKMLRNFLRFVQNFLKRGRCKRGRTHKDVKERQGAKIAKKSKRKKQRAQKCTKERKKSASFKYLS